MWFRTPLETLLFEPCFISSTLRTNWKSFLPPLEPEEGANSLISAFCGEKRKYTIPDTKISRQWVPEVIRLLSKGNQEKRRKRTDQCYQALDSKVSHELSNHSSQVLHAYEDGCSDSFARAKQLGMQCSYELPIAHWATVRRLLAEEAERYPEWEPTLESTREPEEKLFRKEEELRLADRITCPSQFVLDSIPLEIKQKTPCQISPFGSPPCKPVDFERPQENETIKLLFVGSMSQRKGLADLFEAMKLLKGEPISLSILGQPSMPMEFYRKQLAAFEYFPPCSNQKVREIMRTHDAVVLPSIVEGRALVQQEALSCGLPIIVTPNAGGEDLSRRRDNRTPCPDSIPGKNRRGHPCNDRKIKIPKRRYGSCAKKKRRNTPGQTMLKTLLISTCLTMHKGLKLLDL